MDKGYNWVKISEPLAEINLLIPEDDIRPFEVNGKKILIGNKSKQLFGFERNCPHAGASLQGGYLNDKCEVICPLHQYHYDLKSGKCATEGTNRLLTYPVEITEDGIFVGFKRRGFSLFR